MKERIKQLSSEIQDLKEQLEAKQAELNQLVREAFHAHQARRDEKEEAVLKKLFEKVFHAARHVEVEVDPEEGVNVTIWIKHSASQKISDVLRAMINDMVIVKNGRCPFGNENVNISFPYEKLQDVKDGLELSATVDLRSDCPTVRYRC